MGSQVYAILDGARDRRIEAMIRLSGLEYSCLYAGDLSSRLQAAAPYLVHLAPDTQFTTKLLELGWGSSWGFFTVVPPDVTLQLQRRHFRTWLRVQDEAGRVLARLFSTGVAYAAIEEYGGPIPPHEIRPRKAAALAFVVAGKPVFARRVRFPGAAVPAHAYLRGSLAELAAEIEDSLKQGVAASAGGQR